jgi:gliding motility-associated transport system ATP-binding protein
MLNAISLVRSYGDFKAVDNVSFTISPGQIVGLLGHNGAGKTTIMKMLSGHLEPDSGQILLDGRDITDDLVGFQSTLGYLPESLPLYPEMIVADYLDYVTQLKGIPKGEQSTELKRVVYQTGIEDKLLSPISSLSRGYKQRVGVAQAILGKPKLLILDEPTNGLDPAQTEQMRTLIRGISNQATVILSTHIMQEVEALCDRVLILNSGQLAVDANLMDLRKSREIHLSTDLSQDAVENLLKEFEDVESWQATEQRQTDSPDDCRSFRLTLKDNSPRFAIGAKLASKVSEAGGQVYEIRPLTRNLEALVREMSENRSEEATHAA